MKKISMFGLAVFVGFGFAGCGEQDPRTFEYFKNNPDIAKERVAECKKMERMSEKTKEDCQNAQSAISRYEAEISKHIANAKTALSDFAAYHTWQGKFDSSEKMTHVSLPIKVKDSVCVEFFTKNKDEIEVKVNKDVKECEFIAKQAKLPQVISSSDWGKVSF